MSYKYSLFCVYIFLLTNLQVFARVHVHNSAVLLVRSVSAVVCLVAPGVHVDTEAVIACELGVITRGQGHQHIMTGSAVVMGSSV